ncbi:MAG: aminotransferase class I/II-fold pyridoxal phosphate-dependent enzyme [Saprospiraceae bacterium]|nr:aminotransferase class I/II-fold pyridoxal phosphate-dependent enzyme [Saprospiraceae bacterium]
MKINLLSDTITKPSKEMRKAMSNALVGDDVFGEDPTVNTLQEKLSKMFRKEAGLFCPSGTMTNQIAIKVHTNPLDEIICDKSSHVYQYETAGYAFNSGVGVNLLEGEYGKITPDLISKAIKKVHDWLPLSKLVVLENSTNKGGGNYYTFEEMQAISRLCKEKDLKLHLDGARLFNVLVETKDSTESIGDLFDSISICLSKGLGAPIGSVLLGENAFITEARRFRKVMGGGMRQSGIIAAAGIFALDHNIERLKTDNDNATEIGKLLTSLPYVSSVNPVKTNIVIFTLKDETAVSFVDRLAKENIVASPFGEYMVRFVTHMEFTESQKALLFEKLKQM